MTEINIKSSTIEKGLDLAKDLLGKLVGPSIDEVGQLLADKVKFWKFNNQLGRLKGVQEKIEKAGIKASQINLKVLFPWLEGAALEGEKELQEMWENLLVNYIDPMKNLQVTVYPTILSQLSSEEVKILMSCMRYMDAVRVKLITEMGFNSDGDQTNEEIIDNPIISNSVGAFSNLERLGLIVPYEIVPHSSDGLVHSFYEIRKFDYQLTRFATGFLDACTLTNKSVQTPT